MKITEIDRQKAGVCAEAVADVLTDPDGVSEEQIQLLREIREAFRDAERRPASVPSFHQYADGAD